MFYPHYARVKQLYPPPYVREKQLSSSGFSPAAIKIPGYGNLYSVRLILQLILLAPERVSDFKIWDHLRGAAHSDPLSKGGVGAGHFKAYLP